MRAYPKFLFPPPLLLAFVLAGCVDPLPVASVDDSVGVEHHTEEQAILETIPQGTLLKVVVPHHSARRGHYRHNNYPSWGARTHVGIDIWANEGVAINSAWDGTVVDVVNSRADRNFSTLGYMVMIRHNNIGRGGRALYSIALHMKDPPLVSIGQFVSVGQQVGRLGQTGSANGVPHTHYELRYFDDRISTAWGNIYCSGNCTGSNYISGNWEDPETFQLPHEYGSYTTCPNGPGLYCGNTIGGSRNTLYRCELGGWARASSSCALGCTNMGPNNNDQCACNHNGRAPNSWSYCTVDCKCEAGEGDCDNDNECLPGLRCDHQPGRDYCQDANIACNHNGRAPNSWSYCTVDCKCEAGEGDCDNDNECLPGLRCDHQPGRDYCRR